MKINFFQFSCLFLLILISGEGAAWAPFEKWRSDRAYAGENFEKARRGYEKILDDSKDPEMHYNLGNSYYRLEDYNHAEREYLETLQSTDPKLREKGLYNLGNTKYRKKELEEAIKAYQKVLEINPDHEKAKQNLEFVQKKLQEQKKESEKDKQKSEDAENKEAEQGQPGEEQQEEKKEEPKKESEQTDKDLEVPKNEKPEENRKPIAKQEAERWLDSIDDSPKEAIQDMIHREVENHPTKVERDW